MKVRDSGEKAVVVSPPHRADKGDISFEDDPGLTKQEFVKDCDVNVILARCLKMGAPLPGLDSQMAFADVSEMGDFSGAMQKVAAANEAFAALPADIRRRFNWDPAELVAFIADDANKAEAEKLGLLAPKAPVEPAAPAPDVPGAPAPAPSPGAPQA